MQAGKIPIRAVLLDVDGTLVASNDAHAQAWARAFNESSHAANFHDIRPLIGLGGDKLIPKVIGIDADSEEGKKISSRRGQIFLEEYLPALRPTPGAENLLRALRDLGFKLAAASSSKEEELKPLLQLCGADKYISHSTSADDAENTKPDPDILLAALTRLGAKASESVLIGDTPYDVLAARRAGMRVIGLTCGGWSPRELQADETYSHPEDLHDQIEQSMLANRQPPSP